MRTLAFAFIGLILTGLAIAPAGAAPVARPPIVVELFTSQGCSSCVHSGAIIDGIASKPRVIALTFAVDYWDYLGWEDTFAKSAFAERQRAYTKRFDLRDVYTPQIVVDGEAQAAAVHAETLDDLVKAAERVRRRAPSLAFSHERLMIGAGRAPAGGTDVWLVRYDPKAQSVRVTRGENRGKVIVAHNVVRELVRLGGWAGKARAFHLPKAESDGLSTVVLLQAPHGGPIIGAKAQ